VFTDLDFVDDVTLLAEMLEVLVLAMTIIQEEPAVFGLQINSVENQNTPGSPFHVLLNSPGGRWTY